MIQEAMVVATYQRLRQLPLDELEARRAEFDQAQPLVAGYLMACGQNLLTPSEGETVHYLGMVIWELLQQHERRLLGVPRAMLEKADDLNASLLKQLANDTPGDFMSAAIKSIEAYPEPVLLAFIVEAVQIPFPIGAQPIRPDVQSLAFLHLKNVLDAMLFSLAPAPSP